MGITTQQDLLEALRSLNSEKTQYEPKKYRYVIYVRKSTDEEGKQVRSLGDQVLECKQYADKHELKVVEIIKEAESAKEAGIRPKFKKMLTDLNAGKYEGVITWHPDRLARNMKDAGEIIDLLDKAIIKDLQFVSFTFQNDTSGKMMLGITFVLSKEYSDKLSDNVGRGNKHSIAEGKHIGKSKHGYYKDVNQNLRPDGENFNLIKTAFQMRLQKKSLKEIVEYLNQNNYSRANSSKSTKRYSKMDIQKVNKLLRDPVYTGILLHGKESVNLMDIYNFIPMVSVEEFMEINKLTNKGEYVRLAKSYRKGEDMKADLMRGMVFCADCDEVMTAGISTKPNREGKPSYFYFRCTTEDCPKHNKSVRAKVLTGFIRDFLEKRPFSSQQSYDHYVEEMRNVAKQRFSENKALSATLQAKKEQVVNRQNQIKEILLSSQDAGTKDLFKDDLAKINTQLIELDEQIQKTSSHLEKNKVTVLAYSDFIKLMDYMPKYIGEIKNMKELDFIIKKIFLNFSIKDKNVEKYTLNSPFDALEASKVLNGAG